jgi:hypothetical protein
MKTTLFSPHQIKRISRTLNPPVRKQYTNHGLYAYCEANNVSYASMRTRLDVGVTWDEAAESCRDAGLTFIPRGEVRPGWGRRGK